MSRAFLSKFFTSVMTWFVINVILLAGLLNLHFLSEISSRKWWADTFSVVTNLLAGGLVSFLFYFLVVHIPDKRSKKIIKCNLQLVYKSIKRDMVYAVVFASMKGGRSDLSGSSDLIDRLMTPAGFKETFEGGSEADEGFYAFENQMSYDTPEFRDIVLSLQMLSRQIEYVLQNYAITDQNIFDFFKRLELLLMRLQANGPGYDESKPLCTFVWEIFAGWDRIKGDTGRDIIEKMIGDI